MPRIFTPQGICTTITLPGISCFQKVWDWFLMPFIAQVSSDFLRDSLFVLHLTLSLSLFHLIFFAFPTLWNYLHVHNLHPLINPILIWTMKNHSFLPESSNVFIGVGSPEMQRKCKNQKSVKYWVMHIAYQHELQILCLEQNLKFEGKFRSILY